MRVIEGGDFQGPSRTRRVGGDPNCRCDFTICVPAAATVTVRSPSAPPTPVTTYEIGRSRWNRSGSARSRTAGHRELTRDWVTWSDANDAPDQYPSSRRQLRPVVPGRLPGSLPRRAGCRRARLLRRRGWLPRCCSRLLRSDARRVAGRHARGPGYFGRVLSAYLRRRVAAAGCIVCRPGHSGRLASSRPSRLIRLS